MSSGKTIVIERSHALNYRMPLKNPFGTARYVVKSSINFIVQLHANVDGEHLIGVGEAQPRNHLSGDITKAKAWVFFQKAVEAVQGMEMNVGSPEEAKASVRAIMQDLTQLAMKNSTKVNRLHPYRGSLLGIEVALLDLAGQALGVSIAEVLGGVQRDEVTANASTMSTENTEEQLRRKTEKQSTRFPINRLKGRGRPDKDLDALKIIHSANVNVETPKPLWMDLNESLTPDAAQGFIATLADAIAAKELPEVLILEQPVHKDQGDVLPVLQREADELTAQTGVGDIRIMPDESLWDANDVERFHDLGGCRSINIKICKAGGLIASLDAAERALELNPEVDIYIGAMIGTSDLTTWAIHQLAKAMPKLDFLSSLPPGNMEDRISDPLSRVYRGTTTHLNSKRPGLGAALAYDKVAPFIVDHAWYPTPAPSPLLNDVNEYPVEHLQGLREIQLDNHVLEKEALGLGLETIRTSPVDFMARDAKGATIAFTWTRTNLSTLVGSGVTSDKQTTRDLLNAAGVPVPQGRRFEIAQIDAAVAYADSLGYPVVFKPLRGTGGRGVIPGVRDAQELRWAFQRLEGTPLARAGVVVEQHFEGREFRVLSLRDKVLSVVERRPGAVQGDGQLSIGELMLQKHEARMKNPHLRSRRISFGEKAALQLERQGYSFDTVLPVGEQAVYTISPSFHQGGESAEMLSQMHPSILETAAAAVRAVPGLALAGVDFIVPEPGTPVDQQRAGILELNASPAQTSHEFPMLGERTRVSREIVRFVGRAQQVTMNAASAEALNLRLLIHGEFSRNSDVMQWVSAKATSRSLAGWARQWDRTLIECEISGPLDQASALVTSLSRSDIGIRIHRVETTHVQRNYTEGFEVRA